MIDPRLPGTMVIAYIQKPDPFLPGFRAYLPEICRRAILPNRNVSRRNRVGEFTWAVIMSEMDDGNVLISQNAAQYFRGLIECFLCVDDSEYVEVKRIAHVAGSKFVKVAVTSSSGFDPVKFCREKIEGQIKRYTDLKMIFVQHESDIIQYIKNSLYPCPKNSIREVIYRQRDRKATVFVEEKNFPLCLGKGGVNVVSAVKLLDIALVVEPVATEKK